MIGDDGETEEMNNIVSFREKIKYIDEYAGKFENIDIRLKFLIKWLIKENEDIYYCCPPDGLIKENNFN